nr:pentapeptide repeat-containing protein [uncultured Campylobacter sp.]
MRKPYKNPNSNARFATAGFCAEKFRKRGVKFFAPQNVGFFATKFGSTKFCGAEPEARDAEFRDFKFCNETLRHTRRIRQSQHSHFKFHDKKFDSTKFATYGTNFLGTNFRGAEFCKSKFKARDFKSYRAKLRETGFLTRTAKFYAAKFYGVKFHEIKFQTPNLELKMKFNAAKLDGVKFRDVALLKFAAAKGLRRSPSLCAVAPFKFTAPQNAGFFTTKFGEAEFCGVKFHKARLRHAKFYGAEFAAKCEKFCGAKRRGAGA